MNTSDEEIRNAIGEQAAEWLVANQSPMDEFGRQNFLAWLRRSPIHVSEYLSVAGIASDLTTASQELSESIDALVANARQESAPVVHSASAITPERWRERLRRAAESRFMFRAAIAVLVLALAGAGAVWMAENGDWIHSQDYSTAHGVQQLVRLRDGSEVHLDTDSAITVRFSRHERLVDLTRGQAYFRVAHDARRFRVAVSGASVVAVGTEFDVDQRGQSALVTLMEGQLAVLPAGADIPKQGVPLSGAKILNRGEQARLDMGRLVSIGPAVGLPSITAWLEHQIVVDNRPVQEVAAEFNRYDKTPIEIADADVRQMKISGTFRIDDPDSFLTFLQQMDGLSIARGSQVVRLTRHRSAGR